MRKYEYIVKTYGAQKFSQKDKNADESLSMFLSKESIDLSARIVSAFRIEREECSKKDIT